MKGPASAGLFFAFIALAPVAAEYKLSPSGQQYFRAFLETLTPLILKGEKRKENTRWGEKNRDCAGLVRYLFWEALQRHNDSFFDKYPALRHIPATDQRHFPDLAKSWTAENYTAQQLIGHSRFMGRNPAHTGLKTGDLLFFESAELKIRHVMLVIRSGASSYLVYHTGDERNELRIRTLEDIARLPETEWHPENSNPVFRGIYRPTFLE